MNVPAPALARSRFSVSMMMNPQALATAARGAIDCRLDNQGLRSQVRKVRLEFLGAVGGVERRRRRPGGDADECRRHLGTVRQDDRHAIVAAETITVELTVDSTSDAAHYTQRSNGGAAIAGRRRTGTEQLHER